MGSCFNFQWALVSNDFFFALFFLFLVASGAMTVVDVVMINGLLFQMIFFLHFCFCV